MAGTWLMRFAAAAVLAATPAGADVKAGADAWSRGEYAAAVREWEAPAAAGDPDAQFNMGQAYRLGRGVPRDLARAESLFGQAAAQGHVQAADNYGLLMFDRGARVEAMPYIRAASDRGDPRAQYLLGIAHFNGDLAPKDWTRAYALLTLARSAGLTQAAPALAKMDGFVPLPQRQAAASLAARLGEAAQTRRATEVAAGDLAPTPEPARATAPRTAAGPAAPAPRSSPALAGADYARPPVPPTPAKPLRPTPAGAPGTSAAKPALARPSPALAPARPAVGRWAVQLGAFGQAANADALWSRASRRPELAGHPRRNLKAGGVTRLQATGFASAAEAAAACAALTRGGIACLAVQD